MPAKESAMPAHCRAVLCSRRVNVFRMTTKSGMVAMRMAASEALVRAIPRFSKLK